MGYGKGLVLFDSIESATAAMRALDGTRTANDQKLTVEYAKPDDVSKEVSGPNERLFFAGCTGEESEIRTVFQEYSDSIKEISLCMLFTLSDSVTTTHMG